jgi:hypothetical protein
VGGKGNGSERLAKGIASLSNRTPILTHMEKKAPIRVVAVLINKPQALPRPIQPLWTLFNRIVQRQEHPRHSTLGPNRFIGINQATVPVESTEKSTVNLVDTTWKPERQNVIEQSLSKPFPLGRPIDLH